MVLPVPPQDVRSTSKGDTHAMTEGDVHGDYSGKAQCPFDTTAADDKQTDLWGGVWHIRRSFLKMQALQDCNTAITQLFSSQG